MFFNSEWLRGNRVVQRSRPVGVRVRGYRDSWGGAKNSQGMRTLGRDEGAQDGQGRCSRKDMNPGDRNGRDRGAEKG